MKNSSEFDFEAFKSGAMKDLYTGNPLMGEDGIFNLLLKHFLEATLQAEMSNHLQEEHVQSKTNRRNGSSKKEVRSSLGKFDLSTPRDRAGNL